MNVPTIGGDSLALYLREIAERLEDGRLQVVAFKAFDWSHKRPPTTEIHFEVSERTDA